MKIYKSCPPAARNLPCVLRLSYKVINHEDTSAQKYTENEIKCLGGCVNYMRGWRRVVRLVPRKE
jgi:hypothetical protein